MASDGKVTSVKAYANCDDTYVVWRTSGPIKDCRGFALYRLRKGARQPEVVSTWVGFEGETASPGTRQPSTVWPIQKFMWSDYLAREGDQVGYRVVPMCGSSKDRLEARDDLAAETEAPVVVGPPSGAFSAHFNRGIVMSQWIERRLGELPHGKQPRALKDLIGDPADKTRVFLAGELRQRLLGLLADCKASKGMLYAALFELDDPELLEALTGLGERAHVVLSNGAHKTASDDENAEVRPKLREAGVEVFDRILNSSHLGHNKFAVFTDPSGEPTHVWTGSTNWTRTGLCTQANNGLLVDDAAIAAFFRAQWELLKDAGDDVSDDLLADDAKSKAAKTSSGDVTLWFTPLKGSKDLADASARIHAAKSGILFLMFNPGPAGSLLNAILDARDKSPGLYVHGVVNQDPSTTKNPIVGLFHRGEQVNAPLDVVLPEGVDERLSYWNQEISSGQFLSQIGHAMVHSKVIVIDPFGDAPVVMTGSHNMGPKASGKNDENLVIIDGAAELAAAYAVNIMSIYNQYRWRFRNWGHAKNAPPGTLHRTGWNGLKDDDQWQTSYLSGPNADEISFWLGAPARAKRTSARPAANGTTKVRSIHSARKGRRHG